MWLTVGIVGVVLVALATVYFAGRSVGSAKERKRQNDIDTKANEDILDILNEPRDGHATDNWRELRKSDKDSS